MWYILRCHAGGEEKAQRLCRREMSPEVLKDTFVFTYDRLKRYEGSWHIETEKLFPNYVFLETGCGEELPEAFMYYRNHTHLPEYIDMLWQVYPEEEKFLRFLCGKNHHLEMSRGYIRNGAAYVEEGPLRGMEQHITRIDRHKRLAKLHVPLSHGAINMLPAGLEILSKS